MYQNTVTPIQELLVCVHLRLQVVAGKKLTYADLADLAQTSQRSVAEWMRGGTSPAAMGALLHLLSQLPSADATEVLALWRARVEHELKPGRSDKQRS